MNNLASLNCEKEEPMKPEIKALIDKFPCTMLAGGVVRTCPVRLSYPKLWEPDKYDDTSKPTYSASLIFPVGVDLTALQTAARETAVEEFGPNGIGLRSPFRSQDEKVAKGEKGYAAGGWYINVSARAEFHRPQILDGRMMPVTDKARVYPGVWCLVTVRPYAYTAKGNKGIAFGLQHVQLIADDEPIAGSPSAMSQFGTVDVAPNLDSLFGVSA
jgi:hypothetical protein